MILATSSAPAERGARQWALVERGGSAPDRSLLFVDPGSLRRDGDNASARAALVFERPQEGGIKGFEVSYDFRCGARQQRRHDIIFTQANGAAQPSALAPSSWSAVAPGTPAATIREIACGGALPAGAVSIAGSPIANASRLFPVPQLASAAPGARTPPRLVPRDELTCRLQRGETAAQVSAHPDPAPAACRAGAATASPHRFPVAECEGTIYAENQTLGHFSARLVFNIGFGADVNLDPDPYHLTGEYQYANGVLTPVNPRHSHFSMRYDESRHRFEASLPIDVRRRAPPELALRMAGNPYADVMIDDSAQGTFIADCVPGWR
jgi:hypothetical protein